MDVVIETSRHALLITGFVFVMMLVIEYLNVLTSGVWKERLSGKRWGQYVLAAALGATPGCLGAFAVVAMYSHRVVTLGALVAAMVATAGDEAFVMLAMIPKEAAFMIAGLFALGIAAGVVTDAFLRGRAAGGPDSCEGFEVHAEEQCISFPRGLILRQWKECSAARGILAVGLVIFIAAVLTGHLGVHEAHVAAGGDEHAAGLLGFAEGSWVRVTLLVVSAAALFIVSTVPDHFLEEHLWRHVARRHLPRIFLWTLGALLAMHFLTEYLHLRETIERGTGIAWVFLLIACLVGLVPESGPHMVFVTLYARGTISLSILLANTIVQDGHGMLPMLAHSRRAFVAVKAGKFVAGLLIGAAVMALGF